MNAGLVVVCVAVAAAVVVGCRGETVVGEDTEVLPQIDRVGLGINIFLSDPEADGSDSGIARGRIFATTCDECFSQGQVVTGHNTLYRVPDGFGVRVEPACSYDAAVSEVHDTFSFVESVDYEYSKKKCVLWSCHSNSKSFHQYQSLTQHAEYTFVKAKATCVAYRTHLNAFSLGPQHLSDEFKAAVEALPDTYDKDALNDFVEGFGTHYMTVAVLGGRITQRSTFLQANYTYLKRQTTDLEDGALLSFLEALGGDAYVTNAKNYDVYKQFSTMRKEATLLKVPPHQPNVTDVNVAAQWANAVQLPNGQPDIISYDFENVTDLLVAQFFPDIPNVAARAALLEQFLLSGDYCEMAQCGKVERVARWEPQAVAITDPRAAGGAVQVNGSILVVGGSAFTNGASGPAQNPPSAFSNLLLQAGAASRWKLVPPSPVATTGCGVAVVGGLVYVVGGQTVQYNSGATPVADVHTYAPDTHVWREVMPLPEARYDLSVVEANGVLYALGGLPANAALSAVAFDSVDWTTLSPMITPRSQMSAVAYGTVIYTFGGLDASNNQVSSVVELFDTVAQTWSHGPAPIPSTLTPRCGHTSVIVGSRVFLMGGSADNAMTSPLDTVIVYDCDQHSWSSLSTLLPLATQRASAVAIADADGNAVIHHLGGFVNTPSSLRLSSLHAVFNLTDLGVAERNAWPLVSGATGAVHTPRGAPASMPAPVPASVRRRAVGLQSLQPDTPFARPGSPSVRARPEALRATPETDTSTLPVLPGVEMFGYGYHLIHGNPLAPTNDPGWSAQPIFNPLCDDCFATNATLQNRWRVPDGVEVLEAESCQFTADSAIVRGVWGLQQYLDAWFGIDVRIGFPLILGARFTAGLNLHESLTSSLDASTGLVVATARCDAFRMSLDQLTFRPNFTANFLQAVAALPSDPLLHPLPFLRLVETFGMFVPTELAMGGVLSQASFVAEAELREALVVSADLGASAKANVLGLFSEKVSVDASLRVRQSFELYSRATRNTTRCRPQCPTKAFDAATDASAWSALTQLPNGTAVPIGMRLASIVDLVRLAGNDTAADAVEAFLNSSALCDLTEGCVAAPSPQSGWVRHPDLRWPRTEHVGVTWGEWFVVAGGRAQATLDSTLATVEVLRPLLPAVGTADFASTAAPWDTEWATAPAMRVGVSGAAGVVFNDTTLVVIGGSTAQGAPTSLVQSLDLPSLTWQGGLVVPDLPQPLWCHSAVVVGDEVFVLGGTNAAGGDSLAVNKTTPGAGGAWVSAGHTLPRPFSRGAAVLSPDGSRIFVFGGMSAQGTVYSDILEFVHQTGVWEWSVQAHLPSPRHSFSLVALPGTSAALVVGGVAQGLDGSTAATLEVWQFDFDALSFEALQPVPQSAYSGSVALSSQGLFVVGGANNTANDIGRAWAYGLRNPVTSLQTTS